MKGCVGERRSWSLHSVCRHVSGGLMNWLCASEPWVLPRISWSPVLPKGLEARDNCPVTDMVPDTDICSGVCTNQSITKGPTPMHQVALRVLRGYLPNGYWFSSQWFNNKNHPQSWTSFVQSQLSLTTHEMMWGKDTWTRVEMCGISALWTFVILAKSLTTVSSRFLPD